MPSIAKHACNVIAMHREYGGKRARRAQCSSDLRNTSYLSSALSRMGLRDDRRYDDDDDPGSDASYSPGPPPPRHHRNAKPLRSILKKPQGPLPKHLLRSASVRTGRSRNLRQYVEHTLDAGQDEEDALELEEAMLKKLEDYHRFENAIKEQRRRSDIIDQYSITMDKEELETLEREIAMQDYYARELPCKCDSCSAGGRARDCQHLAHD